MATTLSWTRSNEKSVCVFWISIEKCTNQSQRTRFHDERIKYTQTDFSCHWNDKIIRLKILHSWAKSKIRFNWNGMAIHYYVLTCVCGSAVAVYSKYGQCKFFLNCKMYVNGCALWACELKIQNSDHQPKTEQWQSGNCVHRTFMEMTKEQSHPFNNNPVQKTGSACCATQKKR